MTSSEYDALVAAAAERYGNACRLIEASLARYRPFDLQRTYSAISTEYGPDLLRLRERIRQSTQA
ncbi:hypothetical protein [Propionivibrio limicola]|uniref:hypothetical protein n=1 Tax=Propionivibrio limicola TaxID=167645 RepID=UPI00129179B1|nr:hypothetical protein [Propionivibrio limicola]